jgi:hypothetical protein
MKKLLVISLFTLGSSLFTLSYAQCPDCRLGKPSVSEMARLRGHRISSTADSLPMAYMQQNVCGLNYTTTTVLTETRTTTISCAVGTGFPTTLALSGMPLSNCAGILKAYIYYGVSYTETTPPPSTITITNPAAIVATLPATMQGDGNMVCWGETGTATYRVDVTSQITGNGNYSVDVSGFANATWEIDGLTLLVIYTDPTASYSGSIQLNDGDICNMAGEDSANQKGFTVCSATSNATAFAMLGDMQCDVNGGINTETFNGTTATFPNLFWNYCAVPTSVTAGQNSVSYSTYTNNNVSDCYFLGVTGLYWQNTNCVTCTPVVTTMTLTATATPATCGNNGNASVTVTGSSGPFTYLWSGGQTTSTATGLAPGLYQISVSDGSSCAADTVTVSNLGMVLSISSTGAACSNPGTATVSVTGGISPYTYLWSNSATTSSISATAGTYSVTVTDNSGCTVNGTVTISNASTLSASTSSTSVYLCPATLGSVTVTPSGGTPPYTYVWSPGGQTTQTVTGLSAGMYTIHVSDSNGCNYYGVDSVGTIASSITDSVLTTPVYCSALQGTATANPSSGTAPYTYLWSPGGQTTQTVTGLSYGYYTVVVTDANGCSNTTTNVSIGSSSVTTYAYATPPSITPGDSVYLYAGCNVPATYSWSPSSSVTNPTSNATYAHPTVTTTYICTITTACGTYTDTLVITVNCFAVSDTATPTNCNTSNGTVTTVPSGGSAPYTYLWTPGGQTTQTATGLSGGTYTVAVTDSAGCTVTSSVSVSSNSVSFNVTASQDSVLAGDTVILTAYCSSSATYLWEPGGNTSSTDTVTPSVTTTYTVIITSGCGTDSLTITVYVVPYLCNNNFNEQICIVTIDTATDRDKIIWGRVNSPPDGSYDVYKENSSYTFSLLVNQPLTSLSQYIDTSSRPWLAPCTYELSTVDSCGQSSLSSPHTSIFLWDSAGVNVNILNWTPYVGFTPTYYYIYRGSSLSTLVKIDSVPYTVFTYNDNNPPANAIYMIEVVNPNGACIPTMHIVHGDAEAAVSMSNLRKMKNVTAIPSISGSITNVNIYPNPSNGMFTITYSLSGSGYVRFSLVDELGQIVYDNAQQKGPGSYNEQLNLENLASGIYTLRMQTNGGTTVRKVEVIKNR